MQQPGPGQGYHSDYTSSSHYPAPHISRERNEFARMGQEYHAQQLERPQLDPRVIAEPRGRPAAGMDFSSRGSEHSLSQALSSRSPARSEDSLTGSIMAVGRRLREEISVIGHDQKQLQDNILFEIDRIAARMSEQEAVLRNLQDELRRLLELHGVETLPQKQQLYPEAVLPANAFVMQQQSRGPYQDPPTQIQHIPPNFQASTRTYTQAGPELAAYTQSWPSSVVAANSFRRTLDEAHM